MGEWIVFIAVSLLVGGFAFLAIEHKEILRWKTSVEARFRKLFHLVGHHDKHGSKTTDDDGR